MSENKHIHNAVQLHKHTHTQHVPPSNFPFTLQNNKLPNGGIIKAEAEWSPVSNVLLKS